MQNLNNLMFKKNYFTDSQIFCLKDVANYLWIIKVLQRVFRLIQTEVLRRGLIQNRIKIKSLQ